MKGSLDFRLNRIRTSIFVAFILSVWVFMWWSYTSTEFTARNPKYFQDGGKTGKRFGLEVCSPEDRKKQVGQVCENWPPIDDEEKTNGTRFVVDHKHKLVFCIVPKAASTTILTALALSQDNAKALLRTSNNFTRFHKKDVLKAFGLKLVEPDRVRNLTNYTSFFVVRHPFSRLESAFNNKVFDTSRLRPKKFRRGRAFANFSKENNLGVKNVNSSVGAFEIFAKHFVYSKDPTVPYSRDFHWKKMSYHCNPCTFQFDYILREETLAVDSEPIVQLMGYDKNYLRKVHKNSMEPKSKNPQSAKHLQYFHALTDADVTRLHHVYKQDFALYGYHYDFESSTAYCQIPKASGKGQCC